LKVRLYIRIRLANGSRSYVNPIYSANGKLKPFYATVDGKPEHHPEGVYHLRYRKDAKPVWESVGTDPQQAMTLRLKRERLLGAQEAGIEVIEEVAEAAGRPLSETVAEYLVEVKSGKSKKTWAAYSLLHFGFLLSAARSRYWKRSTGRIFSFTKTTSRQKAMSPERLPTASTI
jgi:hypothetical protein